MVGSFIIRNKYCTERLKQKVNRAANADEESAHRVRRHDGQEHSAQPRRPKMPRQEWRRHLRLPGRNVPDEQERSQRQSFLETDVLGVLNRQTATCAASCTAAESRPAAAAEHFRWPRLNRLAESNRARQSRGPIGLERPGSSKIQSASRPAGGLRAGVRPGPEPS